MPLTNPNKVVTEQRLADFYGEIYPYLGGMPEMLANKFSKSNLYSTDEKMIGQWIDGKPLYQKTWDLGSNVTISNTGVTELTSIDGTGIERAIGCFAVTSSVDYATPLMIVHASNDSSVSAVALRSNNSVAVRYITIQYTKTTDTSISIGSDTDYSIDEKIIGTWIDGKPIYQKTFSIENTTSGEYDIGLLAFNIDHIIHMEIIGFSSDGTYLVPYLNPVGDISYGMSFWIDTSYRLCVRKGSKFTAFVIMYLTIQYTKTTD